MIIDAMALWSLVTRFRGSPVRRFVIAGQGSKLRCRTWTWFASVKTQKMYTLAWKAGTSNLFIEQNPIPKL